MLPNNLHMFDPSNNLSKSYIHSLSRLAELQDNFTIPTLRRILPTSMGAPVQLDHLIITRLEGKSFIKGEV